MKTEDLKNKDYKYGFTTDIENKNLQSSFEETIKFISNIKKNQMDVRLRLKAFNRLKVLKEPDWQNQNIKNRLPFILLFSA